MKVILTTNIRKLGKVGDLVNVKDGFARNFLFPKKIALRNTESNLQYFEKIKNSLNFETKKSVKDSVGEILKEVKSGNLNPRDSEFTNMSKLTEKIHQLNNYQFDENL